MFGRSSEGEPFLSMRERLVSCPICFSEDDHPWLFRELDEEDPRGTVGRRCRICRKRVVVPMG